MFGVEIGGTGLFNTIWLLGADEITEHACLFTRIGRAWIDGLAYAYAPLGNFLLEENHVHRKWLESCRFTQFADAVGADGSNFIAYVRWK